MHSRKHAWGLLLGLALLAWPRLSFAEGDEDIQILPALEVRANVVAPPKTLPPPEPVQPNPQLTQTAQLPQEEPATLASAPDRSSLAFLPVGTFTSRTDTLRCLPPPMLGDFFGFCAQRTITVPNLQTVTVNTTTVVKTDVTTIPPEEPPTTTSTTTSTTATSNNSATVLAPITVCDPVAVRGLYKIGVNESPVPQNRVFFRYDFAAGLAYSSSGIPGSISSATTSNTSTTSSTVIEPNGTQVDTTVTTTTTTQTTTAKGAVPPPNRRLNVHTEMFGFEQTAFAGMASFGMRVPIFQQQGDGSIGPDGFGDLMCIFKGVLWRDALAGRLISGGLAVTAPTGPAIPTFAGDIHSVLLQPYVGHLWSAGNFILQGFTSVIVPTDARDITLLYNTLAVNYALYRSGTNPWLAFVMPTLEVHVTDPLNHGSAYEPLVISDIVSFTGGMHVGLGNRSVLAMGVNTPVTGPRPYDIGAIVQLNVRY